MICFILRGPNPRWATKEKKTFKLVATAIQRIIMIHQKFNKIYTKQYIDEFLASLPKTSANLRNKTIRCINLPEKL